MTLKDLDEENISSDLAWDLVFSFKEDDNKNGDAIIVLGCKNMPILEDRVKYAAKLYKEKRANLLLLSGGGIYKDRLETDIMLDLALKYGVDFNNILLEKESTNTKENLINSYRLLKEKITSDNIKRLLIVSSDFHMKRCELTVEKVLPNRVEYSYCCNSSFSKDNQDNEELRIDRKVNNEAKRLIKYAKLNYINNCEVKG